MFNTKGLGPVVALSLLIVVTVGAVFSFNTFFKGYTSDLQVKSQSKDKSTLIINKVIVDEGYISIFAKNPSSYTIVSKIRVNDNDCTLTGSNVIDTNFTQVSTNCVGTSGKNTLYLHTDTGVYKEIFFI